MEFEVLKAFRAKIKTVGFGCRRSDELHRIVVERIDQQNEALRFVTVFGGDDRNVFDNKRVKCLRNIHKVGGAKGFQAEIVESKACCTTSCFRYVDRTAEMRKLHRRASA